MWYSFGIFYWAQTQVHVGRLRAGGASRFILCVCVIILYIDIDLSGNYRANCIYRVLSVSVSRDKIKEKGGKHKNLISKKQKNGIRN